MALFPNGILSKISHIFKFSAITLPRYRNNYCFIGDYISIFNSPNVKLESRLPKAEVDYKSSRGSVTTPVTAAAAATNGEAKSVLAPGP